MKSCTKQSSVRGVAVAGIVLVIDDLLHGPARADAEGLELDLHDGHAVDEQDDVVAVVAVVGVDAELVDDLEVVLAPVLDVDERVVERRAVVAGEAVAFAQGAGGGEDVGGDDLVEQALELAVGEVDAVERLELLAEVLLQRGAVADVGAVGVFEIAQVFRSVLVRFLVQSLIIRREFRNAHYCRVTVVKIPQTTVNSELKVETRQSAVPVSRVLTTATSEI